MKYSMERNPSCSSRNLKISLFKINEEEREREKTIGIQFTWLEEQDKILKDHQKRDTFVKKKKKSRPIICLANDDVSVRW